jgi:hypothetical protein
MPLIPPNSNEQDPDKYGMLNKLQIVLAIGVLTIVLYTLQFGWHATLLTVFGVAIVGAGASLATGFLLGFVFGIPRAVARSGGSAPAAPTGGDAKPLPAGGGSHTFEANSNLVEISDWLTKIFVGVGLVELAKIPGKMKALASYFAAGLRKCTDSYANCVASSEAFAMVIIVFFGVCGFLLGYLWARLYLQKAFDELTSIKEKVNEAQSTIYIVLSRLFTGIGTWLHPSPKDVDVESFKRAMEYLDRGLERYPEDPELHFEKAIVAKAMATKKHPADTDLLSQALAHAQQAAILKPKSPNILFNIACYQALLNRDPKEILPNLQAAIKLKPELRENAKSDPDLQSLHGVPEYEELTKG